MKRSYLKRQSNSETAQIKREIQRLLREIVIERDQGCILRDSRYCNGLPDIPGIVLQADHLITRSNSATYADSRLVVCVCKGCHGWKHWHKEEYDILIKTILPVEIVELWDKCQKESWKPSKMDWKLELMALEQEYEKALHKSL